MKKRFLFPTILLLAFTVLPHVLVADDAINTEYRSNLMSIFEKHLNSIELILSGKTKHWNNLLRHAIALRKSEDFLDHGYMDETTKHYIKLNAINATETGKSLYFYVLDSQHSVDELTEIIRTQKDNTNDTSKIKSAVDQVKESCNKCHQHFHIAQ